MEMDDNTLRLFNERYESGDPYIFLAKMNGAVPEDATVVTHPTERAIYKRKVLALSYGAALDSEDK